VENQWENKIKRVRYDRGGEYFSNESDIFFSDNGIIHERTPPYLAPIYWGCRKKEPNINGLGECHVRNVLYGKGMVGKAILTSYHVLNIVPTMANTW
jgi:hypothetical protein